MQEKRKTPELLDEELELLDEELDELLLEEELEELLDDDEPDESPESPPVDELLDDELLLETGGLSWPSAESFSVISVLHPNKALSKIAITTSLILRMIPPSCFDSRNQANCIPPARSYIA